MNEHFEPTSTDSQNDSPFAIGGLILAMCFVAPVLVCIAVAKGVSLLAPNNQSK